MIESFDLEDLNFRTLMTLVIFYVDDLRGQNSDAFGVYLVTWKLVTLLT